MPQSFWFNSSLFFYLHQREMCVYFHHYTILNLMMLFNVCDALSNEETKEIENDKVQCLFTN